MAEPIRIDNSEVRRRLAEAMRRLPGARTRLLVQTAELIKGEISQREPLGVTGNLRASATVLEPEGAGTNIRVGVGATMEYAAAQETGDGYAHPRGGEAHAVQNAFVQEGPRLLELVRDRLLRELGDG